MWGRRRWAGCKNKERRGLCSRGCDEISMLSYSGGPWTGSLRVVHVSNLEEQAVGIQQVIDQCQQGTGRLGRFSVSELAALKVKTLPCLPRGPLTGFFLGMKPSPDGGGLVILGIEEGNVVSEASTCEGCTRLRDGRMD